MCLLLYSCLLLPFFSHIADMPGLVCLNHLSTGVKSKSRQPSVCDCTTAAHMLQKKQSALKKGRALWGCISGCWYGHWWAPECVQLATQVTNGVFRGAVPDSFHRKHRLRAGKESDRHPEVATLSRRNPGACVLPNWQACHR